MAPSLPTRKGSAKASARKAAPASANNLPILHASEITLPDGTKIPVKIPPGMPPDQATALLAYLQANPEAAKAAQAQAAEILRNPELAHAFTNMHANSTPENAERFAFLKDDPDLAMVWEEVKEKGPIALQKYWDDDELMSKISNKMRAVQLEKQAAEGDNKPAPAPTKPVANLFDAAKMGDVEAGARMIGEGADVNAKNEKNVTALGIAVGFNRKEMVQLLIEKGVDVMQPDGKGNTVLHYAAGYGRQEVAELLISAGAKLDAVNGAKQTPVDVATMNREKGMVEFLKKQTSQ